jgi:hypothetical protein
LGILALMVFTSVIIPTQWQLTPFVTRMTVCRDSNHKYNLHDADTKDQRQEGKERRLPCVRTRTALLLGLVLLLLLSSVVQQEGCIEADFNILASGSYIKNGGTVALLDRGHYFAQHGWIRTPFPSNLP